jgi:hypothetical protein
VSDLVIVEYSLTGSASYADFVIVGWLQFLKVIEENLYRRLVSVDPVIVGLYDGSKPWLERNGH